jgi:hypothetical protein
VRFELTTSSLEGWLAIRAATSAQQLERKICDKVLRFPIGLDERSKSQLKIFFLTSPILVWENSEKCNLLVLSPD